MKWYEILLFILILPIGIYLNAYSREMMRTGKPPKWRKRKR